MATKTYKWKPVGEGEIRLITLLPGSAQSPIKISIHNVLPRQPITNTPDRRLTLDKLQETLPKNWEVAKTHQYKYRYLFEDPNENTSWSHPDPTLDPESWAPCPEIPPQGYEPDYEALSYVCGPTGDNHPSVEIIVVGDNDVTKIRVGYNLAAALQDLRYKENTRTLWIDAISIDQEDLIERAHQVKHISKVYRWARRVVIWLGTETGTSAHAISTLDHIGKQLEVGSDHRRYRSPEASEPDWFRSTCTLNFPDETWKAIEELFQREWWERLWVWQESQLANSRALVLVGHNCMLWQDLRKAIICLRTKDILSSHCPGLRERLQMIEMMTLERSSVSLNLVLNATRIRKCLQPKDKIYGILSIAGDMINRQITPDYTEETKVADVYREVFRLYTLQTQRLDLLASCEYPKTTEDLPSWVPDLNAARQTGSLLPFQLVSGVSGAEVTFDGNCLRAAGLSVGEVATVHDSFSHDSEQAFQGLRDLYLKWDAPGYGAAIDRDVLMRTIRVGYFDEGWSSYSAPTFISWKDELVDAVLQDSRPRDATFAWCLRLVKGRAIFRMRDGRVGLGPSQARKGDLVCILLGCKAPLVIRRRAPETSTSRFTRLQKATADEDGPVRAQANHEEDDMNYEIIGECYIDGLDNGLFGALPAGWRMDFDKIKTGYGATHTYIHSESGRKSRWHPSLEPLLQEWKPFERERRPEDPSTFTCFRNDITGEERNSDPRLTAERLRRRGVAIRNFTFV